MIWRIVGIGATLAGNILAARLLGPADFGIFLLVTTIIALGSLLAMGGLNEAGLRFVSESLRLGRRFFGALYLRRILKWSLSTSAAKPAVRRGFGSDRRFSISSRELNQPMLVVALATLGVIALAWQQIAAESLARLRRSCAWQACFREGKPVGPAQQPLVSGGVVRGVSVSCSPTSRSTWPLACWLARFC